MRWQSSRRRRDDLRDATDDEGNKIKVHQLFENDLVMTRYDSAKGAWVAGPGGATRSVYEPATEKVLRQLARMDSYLAPLAELKTFQAVGLSAKKGRGRPRKTAP